MNRGRHHHAKPRRPPGCARRALGQALVLDAVLCVGLLAAWVSGAVRAGETIAIMVSGGLVKTLLTGLAAYLGCRFDRTRRT